MQKPTTMKIKLLIISFAICGIANAQWQNTNSVSPQMNCVAASGTNVFAGRAGGGVEGSTDNGNNWTICCYNGMTYPYIWSLVIDGTNLFTATGSGVYISTDSAANWTQLSNGLTDTTVLSLVISGTNIFAGTTGGVFFSTNYGNNWTAVNNGLTSSTVRALAISGTNIFAGTSGGGIFLSSNNGGNWTAVNNGLANGNISSVAIDGGNIYAGTSGGGIFLSTNNGGNWTAVNSGLLNLNITSLAVNGGNIFSGTGGGVYLSTNNGASWTAENSGFTSSNISGLAISGANIYASIYMGGVWRRSLSEMVGINEINIQNTINVFPNPFSSLTNLQTDKFLKDATLTVYNSFGQTVKQIKNISGQTVNFHRDNLPSGLYFIRLTQDNKILSTDKIVITDN
ncbi:MAG: T9SS type A sorting domain-containing protein [Thermoplasmata archaeon]